MIEENFETKLQEYFSLETFRLGQKEIIDSIIQGQDVLAVLPTGGGKSLCYQFPAVHLQRLVVVVSPLIALMKDQVEGLKKLGIPAGCLHSSQTLEEKRQIFSEMPSEGAYILYLSPERVQKEGFKNWIRSRSLALFAIDEAHCVSQWGHDFREEYSQLAVLKKWRPDVPTLALTASATPRVLADISDQLQLNKPIRRVHGFYRKNLYYQVQTCSTDEDKIIYLETALRKFSQGRSLIYCGTRKITEQVADYLRQRFDSVEFYHAGLTAQQRAQVHDNYMQERTRILVATNAFGMGVDQPNVRLVVHFQLPASIDSLYQEMGRAGRDGLDSTCLLLYSRKDKGLQSYFIESSGAESQIKNSRWRTLEALVNYAEGSECRHGEILTYYKDSQRLRRCGHCDVCAPDSFRKILKSESLTSLKVKPKTQLRRKNKIEGEKLTEEQTRVFELLRQWRREKSLELDLPAFVVFSDRVLRAVAQASPRTKEELMSVHGMGERKAEKFGSDLLQLCSAP